MPAKARADKTSTLTELSIGSRVEPATEKGVMMARVDTAMGLARLSPTARNVGGPGMSEFLRWRWLGLKA